MRRTDTEELRRGGGRQDGNRRINILTVPQPFSYRDTQSIGKSVEKKGQLKVMVTLYG